MADLAHQPRDTLRHAVKRPKQIDGRRVVAYAKVPPELEDEYTATWLDTGKVDKIAALAVVEDMGTFLLVELDPAGKPLEDLFLESPEWAFEDHPELDWETNVGRGSGSV